MLSASSGQSFRREKLKGTNVRPLFTCLGAGAKPANLFAGLVSVIFKRPVAACRASESFEAIIERVMQHPIVVGAAITLSEMKLGKHDPAPIVYYAKNLLPNFESVNKNVCA